MFRLAHVTDPHFRSYMGLRLSHLRGKRALGLLNLVVNRARRHKMEILEALREDLQAQWVDHLAVTGDLSNVALDAEFQAALRWLELLGKPPDRVSVIPGNHDAYVTSVVQAGTFERYFQPYQTNDLVEFSAGYPFVRVRDQVALVGLNSCVAENGLGAWGRVGPAQLDKLEVLLQRPELKGRTRVVLLHHPPVAHRGGESRNLQDRAQLAAVLARTGAELVLHGHDHRQEQAHLSGPDGRSIPAVGAGSASYVGKGHHGTGSYNVYEIDGSRITLCTRSYSGETGRFEESARRVILPA